MKTLMEHTKHSMTSLEEYIRESLLDDFDELEAAADDNVKASSSLGKKYKVNFVRVKDLNDVLSELNTDKINSLKLLYNEEFNVEGQYGDILRGRTEDIHKLVQSIMDIPANGNWKAVLNKHLKGCLKCLFSIDYLQLKGALSIQIRLRGLYNGLYISCTKR